MYQNFSSSSLFNLSSQRFILSNIAKINLKNDYICNIIAYSLIIIVIIMVYFKIDFFVNYPLLTSEMHSVTL